MIELKKKDIPILDFIIDKAIETAFIVTMSDLKETDVFISLLNDYKSIIPELDENQEFERLMYILNSYGVCKCCFEEDSLYVEANSYTLQFQKEGGFKKVYSDIKEREKGEQLESENRKKREQVERENLEWNTKVSKFQVKSRWWPYGLSVISLMVAILAYFRPISELNSSQLSKDEVIHIIDSISTSNQTKMVDSLLISKSGIDTLNIH